MSWLVLPLLAAVGAGWWWWRSARSEARATLHAVPEPVLISRRGGRISYYNPAFEQICRQHGFPVPHANTSLEELVDSWAALGLIERANRERTLDSFRPGSSGTVIQLGDKHLRIRSAGLPSSDIAISLSDVSESVRLQRALEESEAAKRALFDTAPVGILVTARDSGAILQANWRAATQLGFGEPDELVGRNMSSFYARPDERQQVITAIDQHGALNDQEVELRDVAGNSVWVQFSARAATEAAQPTVYSAAVNITRSKRTEEALRASEHKLRELLELAPNAIFIFSTDGGRVLFLNRLASQLAGPDANGWVDLQVSRPFGEGNSENLLSALRREGEIKDRELLLETTHGDRRWFHVSATLIEYDGQTAMFCAMVDIDDRKQAEAQLRQARVETEAANRELRMMNVELEQLASTDRLTRAFNRRHFEELALREMSRSRRYNLPLALLLLDLDHFKMINDDFGHAAGDAVLLEFVQLTRAHLRSSDVLARWGGEEFVVLAPSTSIDEAVLLADKLRDLFAHHRFDEIRPVTLSGGVTSLGFRDTLDTFIRRADKALYMAKGQGRNRVVALGPESLS